MLLQSDKALPPTDITPNFEEEAKLAVAARVPNQWFKVPEQSIVLGLEDPEDNNSGDNHFGW
jgi:L-histidine Nalpha-methyltransferase / hercynylcysteine S-oxide synthase